MIHYKFKIITTFKKEVIDLTTYINNILFSQKIKSGVCHIFISHTTACITLGEITEGTDKDLLEVAEKIIPNIKFKHAHNPSHAWSHMASSLIGGSLSLPFNDKKLMLGMWQSVLLLELDGLKERKIIVSIDE